MLSRLAFRHVTATPLILSAQKNNWATACILILRDYSSDVPAPKKSKYVYPPPVQELTIRERVAVWDSANKLFYGPDRDMANFPSLVRPESIPPVRLGFIPDSWFQMFYEKTGVTGPYLFGVGLFCFLFSKEIWVYEHQFGHFCSFWLLMYILFRVFRSKARKFVDDYDAAFTENRWNKPLRETVQNMESDIKDAQTMMWREEGQKYLFQAKRENVDLQLEAIYRQRLAEIGQAVKRRLDYQLDVDQTRRRIHQQHMVQWIVDGVLKGITPQQEKESLAKCIQDLKSLAAQQSVAPA